MLLQKDVNKIETVERKWEQAGDKGQICFKSMVEMKYIST